MCIYVGHYFFQLIFKYVINVWVDNSCVEGGAVKSVNAIVWGEGHCWYVIKHVLNLFFQSQSLINTTLWEANDSETLFWTLIEYMLIIWQTQKYIVLQGHVSVRVIHCITLAVTHLKKSKLTLFQNTTGHTYGAKETEITEHLITRPFLIHELSSPGL